MTQDYPLQWPDGIARVPAHKRGEPQFLATIGGATKDLRDEVRRMGGTLPVISTNLALRNDGLPYANQRQPDDPGVALYFQRRGKQLVFACDRWRKVEHNMRAIVKTIEALRGIERWGSADMVDQAFTGFTTLPAPDAVRHWSEVLGVTRDATVEEIQARYRSRAFDARDNEPALLALNLARDEAMLERPTNFNQQGR